MLLRNVNLHYYHYDVTINHSVSLMLIQLPQTKVNKPIKRQLQIIALELAVTIDLLYFILVNGIATEIIKNYIVMLQKHSFLSYIKEIQQL